MDKIEMDWDAIARDSLTVFGEFEGASVLIQPSAKPISVDFDQVARDSLTVFNELVR